jgi:hypothetical protein
MKKIVALPDILIIILFLLIIEIMEFQLNNLVILIVCTIAGIVVIVFSTKLGQWRTQKLEEIKEYWKKKWELEEQVARFVTRCFFTREWNIWLFRILGAAMSGSAIYKIAT